jgi:hypothetical protein
MGLGGPVNWGAQRGGFPTGQEQAPGTAASRRKAGGPAAATAMERSARDWGDTANQASARRRKGRERRPGGGVKAPFPRGPMPNASARPNRIGAAESNATVGARAKAVPPAAAGAGGGRVGAGKGLGARPLTDAGVYSAARATTGPACRGHAAGRSPAGGRRRPQQGKGRVVRYSGGGAARRSLSVVQGIRLWFWLWLWLWLWLRLWLWRLLDFRWDGARGS